MQLISAPKTNYQIDTSSREVKIFKEIKRKTDNLSNTARNASTVYSQVFTATGPARAAVAGRQNGYFVSAAGTEMLRFSLVSPKLAKISNISFLGLDLGVYIVQLQGAGTFISYSFPVYFTLFRELPKDELTPAGEILEPMLVLPLGTVNWIDGTGFKFLSSNPSTLIDLTNYMSLRDYNYSQGYYKFDNLTPTDKNNQITEKQYNYLLNNYNSGLLANIVYDDSALSSTQKTHLSTNLGVNGAFQFVLSLQFITIGLLASFSSIKESPNNYILACHNNNNQKLFLFDSKDGDNFVQIEPSPAYNPPTLALRNPSIMKIKDKFFVAYVNADPPNYTGYTFAIARSDDNLKSWKFQQDVYIYNATNIAGPQLWAYNGNYYILVNLSFDSGASFQMYYMQALDIALTTWSQPQLISGELPANSIDGTIEYYNNEFHLFIKNETTKYIEYLRSPNPFSNYKMIGSGDWAGWGQNIEAPTLLQLDSDTWRIYFDKYTAQGIFYSDSRDGFKTWSPCRNIVTNTFIPSHVSVIRFNDSK